MNTLGFTELIPVTSLVEQVNVLRPPDSPVVTPAMLRGWIRFGFPKPLVVSHGRAGGREGFYAVEHIAAVNEILKRHAAGERIKDLIPDACTIVEFDLALKAYDHLLIVRSFVALAGLQYLKLALARLLPPLLSTGISVSSQDVADILNSVKQKEIQQEEIIRRIEDIFSNNVISPPSWYTELKATQNQTEVLINFLSRIPDYVPAAPKAFDLQLRIVEAFLKNVGADTREDLISRIRENIQEIEGFNAKPNEWPFLKFAN